MRQDVILKTRAKKSLQARKKRPAAPQNRRDAGFFSVNVQQFSIDVRFFSVDVRFFPVDVSFFPVDVRFFPADAQKNTVEVLYVLKNACFLLKTPLFTLFPTCNSHPWTASARVSVSQRSICSVRPVLCPFSVLPPPHRVLRKTARIWRYRKSMCKQNRHLRCQYVKWRAGVPPMPLMPRVRVLRVCRRQSCRRSGGCRA